MSRILLANEAGTGRGHVTTLKVFAQALGSDHIYDAALCRMQHAADLAPLCEMVFPSAALNYQHAAMAQRAGMPFANWAEFLAAIGFADETFLLRQIEWWMTTIRARCSDLVVAEFAPCAMLAARALGVPAISIGQGHSTPPAGMERFPLPANGEAGLVHDEADLLAIVNSVGSRVGLPKMQRFSDVYRCHAQLPRTIAALDPYAAQRQQPIYLPPMGTDCPQPASAEGDEVFVYFSTDEGKDPTIIKAMASLDLPMRVVMPGIDPEFAAKLSARNAVIEPAPLPHALIAERSRVIVHAGQHGATCMGLAFGLPQVAMPCQAEQAANARCVEAMGTLFRFNQPRQDAGAIADAITRAYEDKAMADRAVTLARSLRPELVGDTPAILRGVVGAVLDHAVAL